MALPSFRYPSGMSMPSAVSAGICLWIAAIPAFSQAPTKEQQIEAHSKAAQEFLRKNQPAQAMAEYSAVLTLDPNNIDARGNLGVTYFFAGDYAKAAPHLRTVVKLRPDLSKIQALLGMSERRLGQTAEAESDLEKAFPQLQEEKLRVQAGMELIEIYYGGGNLSKAANIAGTLRQLEPQNTDIQYTAHRIYADLAGETMLDVAMLAPKSARMHQMMAQEMARQGNIDGAIAHYREAVKLDPKLPGLRFELAEALNLSTVPAEQEQVEKEYQAALKDNPFDEKSEVRLGDIALRNSDLAAAQAHFQRAVELQPNDAEACLGMGKVLTQMHRPQDAQPYLERAAKLEPFTAATHYRLSLVYRAAGRTADAQKELDEFQRLKDMKEKLKQVYTEMRLQPVKQERPDAEVGK
jgi:tetratricopeptide (TPR) repeat protein